MGGTQEVPCKRGVDIPPHTGTQQVNKLSTAICHIGLTTGWEIMGFILEEVGTGKCFFHNKVIECHPVSFCLFCVQMKDNPQCLH